MQPLGLKQNRDLAIKTSTERLLGWHRSTSNYRDVNACSSATPLPNDYVIIKCALGNSKYSQCTVRLLWHWGIGATQLLLNNTSKISRLHSHLSNCCLTPLVSVIKTSFYSLGRAYNMSAFGAPFACKMSRSMIISKDDLGRMPCITDVYQVVPGSLCVCSFMCWHCKLSPESLYRKGKLTCYLGLGVLEPWSFLKHYQPFVTLMVD